MRQKPISNSEKYPDAWKIYIECVRKWKVDKQKEFAKGWNYGIPNPKNPNEYLYSDCPGKLFFKFKTLYYQTANIVSFRKFLWWLEMMEGKLSHREYNSNLQYLERL
jgi:hypothetical protein